MQLDGLKLVVGSPVYHLTIGAGTITSVFANSAIAVFGKQEMTISAATIEMGGIKMIGLKKPLVYWQSAAYSKEVSAYSLIIEMMEKL
jgi:hypothetical protein